MYTGKLTESEHFTEPHRWTHRSNIHISVQWKCMLYCTVKVYTLLNRTLYSMYHTSVHLIAHHMCTLYRSACIKCTIAASSISESVQQLSALAPINSTQPRYSYNLCYNMYCISSVFVSNLYCFCIFTAEFKCTHCTDVHHPESELSIWHFHGFQVIANWRLAQIARTLELLQKSKQKIRNSDGMRP